MTRHIEASIGRFHVRCPREHAHVHDCNGLIQARDPEEHDDWLDCEDAGMGERSIAEASRRLRLQAQYEAGIAAAACGDVRDERDRS